MQKALLLIFCLFGTLAASAQTIAMDPEVSNIDFELVEGEFQTIILDGVMVNSSDETVTYNWTKEILQGPRDWEISFCDNTRCWLSFVNEGSVELGPNTSGTADVHLETKGHGAIGDTIVVRMTVYEAGNESNSASALYTFVAKNTTPVVEVTSEADLLIYPNPATDFFRIKNSLNVGSVALFNYVGSEVRRYDANDQDSYSLEGLRTGMYLVRIYDEAGFIKRTVRLHKR